jgi:hypothetical protein
MTTALADQFAESVRGQSRQDLQRRWSSILRISAAPRVDSSNVRVEFGGAFAVQTVLLGSSSGDRVPMLVLTPKVLAERKPIVVAICSQGKERLLKDRTSDIAELLQKGCAVCLIDPRGIGESKLGDGHGRRSSATSITSTALMLGMPLLGQQLNDVRLALTWLRKANEFESRRFVLWGESQTPPNPETALFRQPRDDDAALPAPSEPQAPLLALLTGLFEDDVSAIYTVGGLSNWRSLLADYLVLTAHDSLVPGALTVGDIGDLIEPDRSDRRVVLEAAVDGWNRLVPNTPKRTSPANWFIIP